MAIQDNRPQVGQVLGKLSALPASLLTPFEVKTGQVSTFPVIEECLEDSIAWVEDQATTAFNVRYPPVTPEGVTIEPVNTDEMKEGREVQEKGFKLPNGVEVGYEVHDGNTTNKVTLRKRPIMHIAQIQVVTPILGYTRVYTPEEIKNYVKEGVVEVFTYKLAVEQALLQTIDYQAWGSLFPPLPQSVQIAYAYGFALYDPEHQFEHSIGPGTSFDGYNWKEGDWRDPEQKNWLRNLQQAAICNAAAEFLGQSIGLARGLVSSVSFDGYSRGLATNPFQSEIQVLLARRDELMKRRKRRYLLSTIG
jgi:hypothetical protein